MNHLKKSSLIILLLLFAQTCFCQTITYLDSSQKGVSYRGLSVVTDNIFWVSGSKGIVGKTIDGGQHFTWVKPKGFEKTDFRDIEAFDDKTAIIMGIDSPGVILKTIDGGNNWKVVYKSNVHGIFLDAMAFKNNLQGVCLGDPIDDHFWLVETKDGGNTWEEVAPNQSPEAQKDEACFASSGTNIQFVNGTNFDYAFVSGGKEARLFLVKSNAGIAKMPLPIMKGQTTTGANSLAVNGAHLVVVGGDFNNFKRNDSTIAYNTNGGALWTLATQHPFGYKSCVIFYDATTLIATGLSGVDITTDNFKGWTHFDIPFHVVQKAKQGTAIYLAGGNGRIAKIKL